jgi:hypothetical protein
MVLMMVQVSLLGVWICALFGIPNRKQHFRKWMFLSSGKKVGRGEEGGWPHLIDGIC